MAATDGNGKTRVTVAVLGERLKGYSESVDRALADAKEDRQAIVELGTRVTRLEERMSFWQRAQGIFTAVSSIIAGVIGARQ